MKLSESETSMEARIRTVEGFDWRVDGYKENRKKKTLEFTIGVGGFTFEQLMKLSDILGTTHIEWSTSDGHGCPTCGPDTETCFEARDVKFN